MDEKTLKSISPLRNPRVLYNVICCDSKEEENKGVQVFHTSSYLMEDYLREMAKGCVRPGMEGIDPIIDFTSPDEGKSIKFKREGEAEKTKFILHQFVDRPKGFSIDEKDLNSVFVLDELIYVPTYDEVCEYYYGKGQHMPSERSLHSESEKTTEETQSPRRSRYDKMNDVPENFSDDKSVKDENPCPSGHVYGVEIDKFPKDCESCSKWKDCARAERENKATSTTQSENTNTRSGRNVKEENTNTFEEKKKVDEPLTTRRRRG